MFHVSVLFSPNFMIVTCIIVLYFHFCLKLWIVCHWDSSQADGAIHTLDGCKIFRRFSPATSPIQSKLNGRLTAGESLPKQRPTVFFFFTQQSHVVLTIDSSVDLEHVHTKSVWMPSFILVRTIPLQPHWKQKLPRCHEIIGLGPLPSRLQVQFVYGVNTEHWLNGCFTSTFSIIFVYQDNSLCIIAYIKTCLTLVKNIILQMVKVYMEVQILLSTVFVIQIRIIPLILFFDRKHNPAHTWNIWV